MTTSKKPAFTTNVRDGRLAEIYAEELSVAFHDKYEWLVSLGLTQEQAFMVVYDAQINAFMDFRNKTAADRASESTIRGLA